MLIAGLGCAVVVSRTISVRKIDKNYVWLYKLNPAFLASLPQRVS